MASWFSWSDPYHRRGRREPADVVLNTLMLEFSWQLKEAERQQRARESEYRRLKTGVDYSWLATPRRTAYCVSTAERLGLEDLCCKVPPADCGLVILKYREVMASWFSWSDPYHRRGRREPADVVLNTLMLEFSWQLKEAERQQRARESEYRRLKTGVDYSWLATPRRTAYCVSTAERLGLEDLCCKVPPADCGLVILKY
ncbi:hypothetical protein CRUP_038005, partial [Coryphaenoides rupestris]